MDNTPHTPTPFKNALEKYGPLKPLVCGLGRSVRVGPCSESPLSGLIGFFQQPWEVAAILILQMGELSWVIHQFLRPEHLLRARPALAGFGDTASQHPGEAQSMG